jgi:hypothetical protein
MHPDLNRRSHGAAIDVEKFSGFAIKNRKVSAKDMLENMQGRKTYQIGGVLKAQKQLEDASLDWVLFGVLASKTMSKSASSGSNYCIWKVSDLRSTSLSVFLHGDAYEGHRQQQAGKIVAIVNAKVLPAKNGAGKNGNMALAVRQACEIAVIGDAVDFGVCKGTKKTGEKCTMVVNTSVCDYCEFHAAAQYKKLRGGRLELNAQGSSQGIGYRDTLGAKRQQTFQRNAGQVRGRGMGSSAGVSAPGVGAFARNRGMGGHMGRQQVHLSEGTYDTSRGKQRGGLGNTGMLQIDNRGTMQHHVSEQELRNNKRALLSSKNNVAKRESAKVHEKLRNVVDNANAGVQNGANGEPTMKLSNGVRHLAKTLGMSMPRSLARNIYVNPTDRCSKAAKQKHSKRAADNDPLRALADAKKTKVAAAAAKPQLVRSKSSGAIPAASNHKDHRSKPAPKLNHSQTNTTSKTSSSTGITTTITTTTRPGGAGHSSNSNGPSPPRNAVVASSQRSEETGSQNSEKQRQLRTQHAQNAVFSFFDLSPSFLLFLPSFLDSFFPSFLPNFPLSLLP